MNDELLQVVQAGQSATDPKFKALKAANSALTTAARLAAQEKLDALPMQKALTKLQQAAELVKDAGLEDAALDDATAAFGEATQAALDSLAFQFARDLKESFEARGQEVEGRPPTLVVDQLVLQIDIGARKAQWFYGKEALTKPLPLSLAGIIKAYDQQRKAILERKDETPAFLAELYKAWNDLMTEKTEKSGRRPQGNRIALVETYAKLVLNRQVARFWNAPSRGTFKDYERPFFVRDLVLANEAGATVEVDGKRYRLRLGTATKSQADSPARSVWVPNSALGGDFYGDITFE
ncbi:MAG: hypothetical protein KF753_11595 [Caldilineaceae bacterium]|nr:hypothetical protein [Caldilineaceae bacterium]